VLGGKTYIGGFVTQGYWVVDLKGLKVAECYNQEVAKALAKELNQMFEYGHSF
jgi:hypothetical protein